MRSSSFHFILISGLSCAVLAGGCSDDSDDDSSSAGASGSAGSAGASGSAGSAGASGSAGSAGASGSAGSGATGDALSFFVTSETHATGDLGGLSGADETCQTLAAAVGAGDRTWAAYLSADDDGSGSPVNARDRIGSGPWVNANGMTVAEDLDALHALTGDVDVFVDENGMRINGQWADSPTPNQHDMLTGSTAEGMVMPDMNCESWTSASADIAAQVGHADGLGPMMNAAAPFNSWNSAHANQDCSDTAPRGGAGRFYCFATD